MICKGRTPGAVTSLPEIFERDGRQWERVRAVARVSESDRTFVRLRVEGDRD